MVIMVVILILVFMVISMKKLTKALNMLLQVALLTIGVDAERGQFWIYFRMIFKRKHEYAKKCKFSDDWWFSKDKNQITSEFNSLKNLFDKTKEKLPNMNTLSMGMSGDYQEAIRAGATMVRIGWSLFEGVMERK